MSFINTTPLHQAEGAAKEMLLRQQSAYGYVPNYAKVFCYRPQVMTAWSDLQKQIRRTMSVQRYELVTLASAIAMKNSYCSLAHGKILAEQFYSDRELLTMISDYNFASEQDKKIYLFAIKVTLSPSDITQNDIDALKQTGLTDEEIFDVVTATCARCFFGRIGDALGVQPDSTFLKVDEELRGALVIGRQISQQETESI